LRRPPFWGNAQFEHINAKVVAAQAKGQPVISVDTKKKELIGNYKNGGIDYRPKRQPWRVKVRSAAGANAWDERATPPQASRRSPRIAAVRTGCACGLWKRELQNFADRPGS
jgi:hypothetical protein